MILDWLSLMLLTRSAVAFTLSKMLHDLEKMVSVFFSTPDLSILIFGAYRPWWMWYPDFFSLFWFEIAVALSFKLTKFCSNFSENFAKVCKIALIRAHNGIFCDYINLIAFGICLQVPHTHAPIASMSVIPRQAVRNQTMHRLYRKESPLSLLLRQDSRQPISESSSCKSSVSPSSIMFMVSLSLVHLMFFSVRSSHTFHLGYAIILGTIVVVGVIQELICYRAAKTVISI